MAPLCYAAKFDPFLSLDCARLEGEGGWGKFCHLATLLLDTITLIDLPFSFKTVNLS